MLGIWLSGPATKLGRLSNDWEDCMVLPPDKVGAGHNWEGTSAAAEGDMFDELIGKV